MAARSHRCKPDRSDPSDLAWLAQRLVPQPVRAAEKIIRRANPEAAQLPHTYIACTGGRPSGLFAAMAQRAREEEGWPNCELATGHDAMVTMPEELSALLALLSSYERMSRE